jgi:hypothetical protein
MNTVYKYKIKKSEQQQVEMPMGARIVAAQSLGDNIWLWSLVDTDEKSREKRNIVVMKTGQEISIAHPDRLLHLGTVMFDSGALVYHVFELPEV